MRIMEGLTSEVQKAITLPNIFGTGIIFYNGI